MQRYLSDQISTHSTYQNELLKDQKVNLSQSNAPPNRRKQNIVFSQPAETTANPVVSQLQVTSKENKIYTSMSAHHIQTPNTKLSGHPKNTVANTKQILHSHTQSTSTPVTCSVGTLNASNAGLKISTAGVTNVTFSAPRTNHENQSTSPFATQSTVYQNLQQTRVDNFAPTASNTTTSVDQIAEALAKVTQLQRLPQAKPDIFTGEEKDIKFFIWETAFDALIDAAPINVRQKLYLLF